MFLQPLLSLLFASCKLNSLFREIRLRFVINLPLKLPAAVGFFGILGIPYLVFCMLHHWSKCFCIGSIRLEQQFAGCDVRPGFSTTSNTLDTFVPLVMHLKGNYQLLRTVVDRFDYMGDSPFCFRIYIVLDALYPASKFILTVRTKIPGSVPFVLFIKPDCLRRSLTHP